MNKLDAFVSEQLKENVPAFNVALPDFSATG